MYVPRTFGLGSDVSEFVQVGWLIILVILELSRSLPPVLIKINPGISSSIQEKGAA